MGSNKELVERLKASGTKNAPRTGNGVYMSICDEAASAIEALEASNAALMEERSNLMETKRVQIHQLTRDNELNSMRAQAAEAERDRLREALKPFAELHPAPVGFPDNPVRHGASTGVEG